MVWIAILFNKYGKINYIAEVIEEVTLKAELEETNIKRVALISIKPSLYNWWKGNFSEIIGG